MNRPDDVAACTPLREVRLNNFKSVRGASVELRPLTVIVGRNSSGKSTLLQGILALAQAVRREVVTQTFPLNGDLVRLGTFDEVRNFDVDESAGIDIGFTAEIGFRLWGLVNAGPRVAAEGIVNWDAHLMPSQEETGAGQAVLDTIEFGVNARDGESALVNVSLTVNEIRGAATPPEFIGPPAFFLNRGGVELEIDGRVTDLHSGAFSKMDLMSMSGGMPVRVFRLDQRFNVMFRLWWDFAVEHLADHRQQARRETADSLVESNSSADVRKKLQKDAETAVRFARDCMLSEEEFDTELSSSRRMMQMRMMSMHWDYLSRFENKFAKLKSERKSKIANALNDLGEPRFRELVRAALEKDGVDWLEQTVRDEPTTDVHQVLEQATFETHSLFQQVRYLGPLRAKPQAMYSPGVGQVDLGPEGEYAAAYLHANSMKRVLVPLPGGGKQVMPLGEGLNLWLEELGLADGAVAKDRGRLGIGLYVQPVGRQQSVDLTSVGVGVSQALPVVLLCLLATPGSIVLIEQPELHLHPAMQLRLADFLLACSQAGRQILIETHSEHVVNRLRRHVVADEGSETADIVRLLFAEQEAGATVYSVSDINEVGGLRADWPKGFLDVAAEESTLLLEQSLVKKRAQHQNKS
jgi:energy-coupling factor transporter ATP-binding protein EcfA2